MLTIRSIPLWLALLTVTCLGGMMSSPALAQSTVPLSPIDQRTSQSPRLSPYLNLLRQDNSTLSPYHSFVRPQREVYQQQVRQTAELQRLGTTIAARRPQRSPGSRLTTGNGASFQTFLHFYPTSSDRP